MVEEQDAQRLLAAALHGEGALAVDGLRQPGYGMGRLLAAVGKAGQGFQQRDVKIVRYFSLHRCGCRDQRVERRDHVPGTAQGEVVDGRSVCAVPGTCGRIISRSQRPAQRGQQHVHGRRELAVPGSLGQRLLERGRRHAPAAHLPRGAHEREEVLAGRGGGSGLAAIFQRGEHGAHLVGFGHAQALEDGETFLIADAGCWYVATPLRNLPKFHSVESYLARVFQLPGKSQRLSQQFFGLVPFGMIHAKVSHHRKALSSCH